MKVEACSCGSEPVVEPGPTGFRNWDVCCLNCGASTAVFPNRNEAVLYWNSRARNDAIRSPEQTFRLWR